MFCLNDDDDGDCGLRGDGGDCAMRTLRIVELLLLFALMPAARCRLNNADAEREQKLRAIEELRLDGPQYRRLEKLHLNAYVNAMAALVGAVGRDTYKKLSATQFVFCRSP